MDGRVIPKWRKEKGAREAHTLRNPANGRHPAAPQWDRWTARQRRLYLDYSCGVRVLDDWESWEHFNFPKIPGKHGDGWDVVHKEWMPSSRQLLVAEFSGKSPDYLSSVNSAIAIARKGLREFRDSMRKALKERGRAQGGAGPVRGTDSVLARAREICAEDHPLELFFPD